MGAVFNPLIQNTTQTNQLLAAQMTRIADFFGVPQTRHREQVVHNPVVAVQEEPTINQIPSDSPQENIRNQEDVVEFIQKHITYRFGILETVTTN